MNFAINNAARIKIDTLSDNELNINPGTLRNWRKKYRVSSLSKRTKVSIYRRSSLRVSIGEDVRSLSRVSERLLQMAYR